MTVDSVLSQSRNSRLYAASVERRHELMQNENDRGKTENGYEYKIIENSSEHCQKDTENSTQDVCF